MTNVEAGKKLKSLRTQLGKTRIDIQKLCNISDCTIKFWESGAISPASKKLKEYLNFFAMHGFNIELEWLFNSQSQENIYPMLNQIAYLEATSEIKVPIANVIKILEKVSKFCYHLDIAENVQYFNQKSIPFLLSDFQSIYNVKQPKLQDLTTSDMYETCLLHYKRALEGKETYFDYKIENSIMHSGFAEEKYSKMLYMPLMEEGGEVTAVLSFLSGKIGE